VCGDSGPHHWHIAGVNWLQGGGLDVGVARDKGYNRLGEQSCQDVDTRDLDANGHPTAKGALDASCDAASGCIAGVYDPPNARVRYLLPDGSKVDALLDASARALERHDASGTLVYHRALALSDKNYEITAAKGNIIYAAIDEQNIARIDLGSGDVQWQVQLIVNGELK
jgi:hypothetical protein